MPFDAKTAGAFCSELDILLRKLSSYGLFLSKAKLMRHGGKANNFSQVLQRGLSETQLFYDS